MSGFMELYFCETCGWGKRNGKGFGSFVDHVRGKHGKDVRMGSGVQGDSHFCYCNDCPRSKDGHGRHMVSPTSVMKHLYEAHSIEGAVWPEADDDSDYFLGSLSLRGG